MRMQPDFEKANEIYFRLGIIYKQQQKYQQSLEVGYLQRYNHHRKHDTDQLYLVFPIHCLRSTNPIDRGRYLVPNWSRPRATKRCKLEIIASCVKLISNEVTVRQCEIGISTCAGPRSESCKGPSAAWLVASPTKQQLQQPRASY